MNKRKSVLYVLIIILCVVLFYNYIIAPIMMQYGGGMSMGMHRSMYNNYNYYVDIRYILFIIIAIIGFVLFELLLHPKYSNKCSKCGYEIKDERWRICPICGSSLNHRKGDIL